MYFAERKPEMATEFAASQHQFLTKKFFSISLNWYTMVHTEHKRPREKP